MDSVDTKARTWPDIEKTPTMRQVETAFDGQDVRDVLLAALTKTSRDADVVYVLGAKIGQQLHEATISVWIRRLGIVKEAKEARANRL